MYVYTPRSVNDITGDETTQLHIVNNQYPIAEQKYYHLFCAAVIITL